MEILQEEVLPILSQWVLLPPKVVQKATLQFQQHRHVTTQLFQFDTKLVATRDSKGGKMKKMQEVKHLNDAKNNSMKEILTEQQYSDYLKLMEEQKEKVKEKRGGQKFRK